MSVNQRKPSFPQQSPGSKAERGAILPLFVLLLPVVVLFIAAAIDLNRWANIRRADEYFGQLAAIKGLQGWMANPNNQATFAARMTDTQAIVQTALGSNLFIGNASFNPVFHPNDPTQGAVLQPGHWYFNPAAIPAGSTRFVLANPATGLVNLLPLNPADPAPAPTPPNAMQVLGAISPNQANAPFLLGAFMNGMSQTSSIRIIASVTPRIQAFLVDTTPNMTQTTHINRTTAAQAARPALGYGSKFAFFLTADMNPVPATPPQFNNDAQWDNFLNLPTSFRRTSTPFLNPAALATNRVVHTADDYRRTVLWNDATRAILPATSPEMLVLADPTRPIYAGALNLGMVQRTYWIDHQSPMVGTGPAPLRDIFAGISTAVQVMQTQAVAGDLVCLILFDNSLAWTRTIPCTSLFTDVLAVLNMGGASTVEADDPAGTVPLSALTVAAAQSPFRRAMRRNWFPNINSFTDMQLAYNMATLMINDAGGNQGITRNSITFITDGLNNVSYTGLTGTTASNTWPNHQLAITELQNLVRTTATLTNTSVNTILIGDQVAPTMTNIRAPGEPFRCMTPEEMRRAGVQETNGGNSWNAGQWTTEFNNASAAAPYRKINVDMARLSQDTGGIFAPVLRNDPTCPSITYSAANPCPFPPAPTSVSCDPVNTQQQQIQAYMPAIIGPNPYTVVFVGNATAPQP